MRLFKRCLILGLLALLALAVPHAALAFGVVGETTDTTDLNAAMKVLFEDSIWNDVVKESELTDIFEEGGGIQTEATTGGRYIETSQMFGLPTGTGFRGENGYIPVPRGPKVVNGRINLKKVLGTVEVTGDVLEKMTDDRVAFLNWAEQVMPKLEEGLVSELDRCLVGYGAGIKARVAVGGIGAGTVVPDRAYGITGMDGALFQFLVGEQLRAGPNADGTGLRAATYVVNDIDHENGYLHLDGVAGLVNSDYFFSGDAADNSAGLESMGLFGIADDGGVVLNFQNVDRATYHAWQSYVCDAQASPFAAGQQLTEDVIVYADDVSYERGGAKIDLFVTSRLGARQYWASLKGDRSLNDPRTWMGGKGPLQVNLTDRIIPLKVARKVPPQVAFGVTKKFLKRWMPRRFQWIQRTGSLWHQVVDATGRKDAFYAYGTMYLETGTTDAQKHFRIENVAQS